MIGPMTDLAPAVDTVIDRCLAVKPGEDVAGDRRSRHPRDRRGAAGRGRGGRRRRGAHDHGRRARSTATSRRRTVAARSRRATCSSRRRRRSLSHTVARKRASEAGARGATMPGVTEDMLARVMAVDFDTMAARSKAVADAARPRRRRAHVTLPARHRLHARPRAVGRGSPTTATLTEPGRVREPAVRRGLHRAR